MIGTHRARRDYASTLWFVAFTGFCAWVANRLRLFDVWSTVVGPDGLPVRLADTFATIDHPFHAARAETLRRALLDGEILRWIGHHHGGYPVEFYPLGVAWAEVLVWAGSIGTVPMEYAHKVVVVAVFLLPGLAFWLLARTDGLGPSVAFAALAAHVAVPGFWWHGGYTELVGWGLVTNVAAAVASLFVLWGLVAFVQHGRTAAGAVAALAAAFSIVTNPRSLIALAVVGVGVWAASVGRSDDEGSSVGAASRRVAIVGAVAGALAAPELISLARFSELYAFVQYQWYDGLRDYARHSIDAVSPPVAALGAAGVLVALFLPGRPATRAAAITLLLYVGTTVAVNGAPGEPRLIDQLEATRLMPFQRYLTVFLAAVALQGMIGAALPRRPVTRDVLVAVAALGLLIAYVRPIGPLSAESRGLAPVLSTATPEQADFRAAVEIADAAAPPDQALLVLGTTLGAEDQWHQPLWAPFETDRPLFYDNWLWYWHPDHYGPWDFRLGNHYPVVPFRWPETLERDYLDHHGIAAVIVTGEAIEQAADQVGHLRRVRDGVFDVYLVDEPAPIVTIPGGTTSVAIGDGLIVATGDSQGGEATVARNWYPRWRATVNGEPAPITRTDDGYMAVPVPSGPVRLEVTYGVDGWDWLGRGISLAGLVGVVGMVVAGRGGRATRLRSGAEPTKSLRD